MIVSNIARTRGQSLGPVCRRTMAATEAMFFDIIRVKGSNDMFRPMRRIKQQLGEDESWDVLRNAKRGVLSVIGDEDWPYGMHLNPYCEDGKIYFHGAKAGHKIDALRRDARASFTAIDGGVKDENGWAYTFRNVVADVAFVAGMALSVWLLSVAMKTIPMGTAYAVWTGVGAVGGFVAGIVLFGESASALRIASAALIVAGIIGLKLAAK